jgi:hypothetical protein
MKIFCLFRGLQFLANKPYKNKWKRITSIFLDDRTPRWKASMFCSLKKKISVGETEVIPGIDTAIQLVIFNPVCAISEIASCRVVTSGTKRYFVDLKRHKGVDKTMFVKISELSKGQRSSVFLGLAGNFHYYYQGRLTEGEGSVQLASLY